MMTVLISRALRHQVFHHHTLGLCEMTKHELLAYLADAGFVDAYQVAADWGTSYPVAAMALVRLVRQALVSRARDSHAGLYRYQLSERGDQRLAYFQERDDAGPSRSTTFDLRSTE
jgi:hypothetical protein